MAAERFWRYAGIIGMVLGVASFIAATLINTLANATGTPFDQARDNPDVWLLVGLLGVFGQLVWVAGIVSITMLVRSKGWTLTTLGGYVTAIGLICGVGHIALYFGLATDAAGAGLDTNASTALLQADEGSALTVVLLVVYLVAFSLGPILLTVGLRFAKLVPVWVPVAAIIMLVAGFSEGGPAGIVLALAAVATYGPMVVLLARQKEAAV